MSSPSESTITPQKILIVDRYNTLFAKKIKEHLAKYDNDIYVSTLAPRDISQYAVCFVINGSSQLLEKMLRHTSKKIAFIYSGVSDKLVHQSLQVVSGRHRNLKIIRLENPEPEKGDIEKILWFTLTPSNEYFLNMHYINTNEEIEVQKSLGRKIKNKFLKPKRIIFFIFILLLLSHILFIPPLFISSYYLYKTQEPLQKEDIPAVQQLLAPMNSWLSISKKLYSFARPTFLLFGAANFPENIFQLNETGYSVIKKSMPMYTQSKELLTLLMKKNKSDEEVQKIIQDQKELVPKIADLETTMSYLYQKFPEWNVQMKEKKLKIKEILDLLEIARKFMPHFNAIFAQSTEKKYLLLFANNMEIRPGGGFIGSFGTVTVKNYNISKITVYDVYDADGQLSAHIPPPEPIRIYLHQPHWFLRDSAFSADFYENYQAATKFLDREMNFTGFDGGLLITTTTIQQILDAVGDLYIPDVNEVVNKDNFYLKAQLYAEKNFFPGSIQKKSFLSKVSEALMVKLEDSPPPGLIPNIIQSFSEKQSVLYFEDKDLQHLIDSLYWSGKIINPVCSFPNKNCIVDYLFPVDANLGVNKANFFVTKFTSIQITADTDGNLKSVFHIKMRNNSPRDVFPGGTYKNYLQVLIPANTTIKRILKNDTLVEDYEEKNGLYKTIGFYIEIPPHKTSDVLIEYTYDKKLTNGTNHYQLVVQKQIGSSNHDFNFSLKLPKNIYLINQNFSPLVKDNTILYNTTIKADKIFFLELLKE